MHRLLVDTHAHMVDEAFDADREEVLSRARAAGVRAVVCVSESPEEAVKVLELSRRNRLIIPAAGLYPSVLDFIMAEKIIDFIRRNSSVLGAIGEVGLDYWLVKEEHERGMQREILRAFIDLSLELDLPLNLHSRSAGRHIIDLLLECGAKKVQLHAFDGKAVYAARAVEAGFYFSIPPSIDRSVQKQKLVRQLPLESLLLETDSPVLGQHAQERNEPVNVRIGMQAIADLKGLSAEEVRHAVARNFQTLYGAVVV